MVAPLVVFVSPYPGAWKLECSDFESGPIVMSDLGLALDVATSYGCEERPVRIVVRGDGTRHGVAKAS
jgi:hypothetical protein